MLKKLLFTSSLVLPLLAVELAQPTRHHLDTQDATDPERH